MKKIKVMTVFGTRPEAIKMAPIIKEMETDERFQFIVTVTGQHRQMLDQVLKVFNISPDFDLNIMEPGQTLAEINSRILSELDKLIKKSKPDIVLVHGDTTTAFASSLAAFYNQVKIGHVEAGLRTWNKYSPFPEEMNRQLIDDLADLYFAPTEKSKENLLKENCTSSKIYVTGNTVIDAMKYTIIPDYHTELIDDDNQFKYILLTMHRRENIGLPMIHVFKAINRIIQEFEDIQIIFPIHKNPMVRELANEYLINSERINIIEPLDVVDFQNIANKSYLILTDSGGVQEEAPSLGVPVLVLRDTTERPEGVEAGTLLLVGTDEKSVYENIKNLVLNSSLYKKMAKTANPYGDGESSKKILEAIVEEFQ